MNPTPWDALGQAFLDYLNGDKTAAVRFHSEYWEVDEAPVSLFFRDSGPPRPLEDRAVELCRGRILDAGAGAGIHALALQRLGFKVCAIDVSPLAVEVMVERGLSEAHCADIFSFDPLIPFDTLLLLMNGIGIVENLEGLQRFLERAHTLLRPDGQILLDSSDPRTQIEANEKPPWESKSKTGVYWGETQFQIEYKGKMGEPFGWLFVDSETLAQHARQTGWTCQVLRWDKDGRYLARLIRAKRHT